MTNKSDLTDTEWEDVLGWVKMGMSVKGVAGLLGMGEQEFRLKLKPECVPDLLKAEAFFELDNIQKAHDAATSARAPIVVKVKYHMDNLKRLEHHAPASKPTRVVEAKQEELPEFGYEPHTPAELAAIARETNRESDDDQE